MSDQEFERQVQQKMDELKFSPSADVWKGIELDLDKRKRRLPAYWWAAALILLLAGGGYLFYSSNTSNPSITKKTVKEENATAKSPTSTGETTTGKATSPSAAQAANAETSSPDATNQQGIADVTTSTGIKQGTTNNLANNKSNNNTRTTHYNRQEPASIGVTESNQAVASITTDPKRDPLANLFPGLMPGTSPTVSNVPLDNQATAPALNNSQAVAKKETKEKSGWSYGFTAQVGKSGMNEGGAFNFNRASLVDLSGGLANSSFLPANSMIYTSSEVEPGTGFSLGGYAQRSLNKKFDLSLGLAFTRFTSSVMVGMKINEPVPVNASRVGVSSANPYYTREPENKYKMNYDFVEVPVNIIYKFNPSSKLPVSVNAGLVGGRLVGSNALHFDGSSAGYFKNNELLRKWQLGVNAGIALTIMNKSKHPVTMGPSFRYQMTNTLVEEVGAKRNIIGVGFDARIKLGDFGKKK